MKKVCLVFFALFFIVTSCRMASYQSTVNSDAYGIDFREGTWLLGDVESPLSINDKLNKIAIDGFSKHLGNNLLLEKELNHVGVPFVPLSPDNFTLEQLKEDVKSDYYINIKCTKIKGELGVMQLGTLYSEGQNMAETTVEVYDLNTFEVIYSKTIIGNVTARGKDEDFKFQKSTTGMMVSSLKKIIRSI